MDQLSKLKDRIFNKKRETDVSFLFELIKALGCAPEVMGREFEVYRVGGDLGGEYEVYGKGGDLIYTIKQKPQKSNQLLYRIKQKPWTSRQLNVMLQEFDLSNKRQMDEMKKNKQKGKGKR